MPYPGGYGTIILEQGQYTPSLTQLQNTDRYNAWYDVSADLYMTINLAANWTAAAGTGSVTFGLPVGWQFDTARLGNGTAVGNSTSSLIGTGRFWNQGVAPISVMAVYNNATSFVVQDHGAGVLNLSAISTADGIGFNLRVPVKRL